MPIDWSEGILLVDLADEPLIAEEFSAVFQRLTEVEGDKTPHVVMNFGGVTYLNSSHIAALLRMRKRLAESDRRLVLASMSDDLWSILRLTGLDNVFIVAPDTVTALARVQLEGTDPGSPES